MMLMKTILFPFIGILSLSLLCIETTTAKESYSEADKIFEGVHANDPELIQKALDDGSDVDVVGPGGQTPLLTAVLSGKKEAAEALIKAGADLTATEKDGYNVAHAAGFQGRAQILDMLLDYPVVKKMVMEPHKDGYYPIHRACWGIYARHAGTVEIFVKKGGVDINLKAKNGEDCRKMTKNADTLDVIFELKASAEKKEKVSGENEEL